MTDEGNRFQPYLREMLLLPSLAASPLLKLGLIIPSPRHLSAHKAQFALLPTDLYPVYADAIHACRDATRVLPVVLCALTNGVTEALETLLFQLQLQGQPCGQAAPSPPAGSVADADADGASGVDAHDYDADTEMEQWYRLMRDEETVKSIKAHLEMLLGPGTPLADDPVLGKVEWAKALVLVRRELGHFRG